MADKQYFKYGEAETQWLKTRDAAMSKAIDEIGHIRRAVTPDLFMALANAIVGQQISTKAQATVWARMLERFSPFTPETIAATPVEELQKCGISMRKAGYISSAANAVASGELNLAALHALPDEEVCSELSRLSGIGVWTAEMLMTFSMQRMDVMSWGDLAIHRGLRMLHGHRKITPALFQKYRRRYSPYGTVASLYLWAIAGGVCPHLSDNAPKTKAKPAKKSGVKK